jgi:predicted secreted protein
MQIRHVKKTEFFQVQLEEDPDSGCRWAIETPNPNFDIVKIDRLIQRNKSYQDLTKEKMIIVFTIKPKEFGEFTLRMFLRRPWEPKNPVDTFEENIKVE